jgi:hypothetical protein
MTDINTNQCTAVHLTTIWKYFRLWTKLVWNMSEGYPEYKKIKLLLSTSWRRVWRGQKLYLYSFLTLALDGRVLSASRLDCHTHGTNPCPHWMGCKLRPRTGYEKGV